MHERGFNIAYYLEFYAPNILERAMDGLHGEPRAFFDGLTQGQIQGQKELNAQKEKDVANDKEKEDKNNRTDEREREAAYKEKLEREKRAEELMKDIWNEHPNAKEENLKPETEKNLYREEKSDDLRVESRMKEIEEIRGEQGKEMERG